MVNVNVLSKIAQFVAITVKKKKFVNFVEANLNIDCLLIKKIVLKGAYINVRVMMYIHVRAVFLATK